MDKLATRRVYLLARLAFVWAALIVARLVQIQVVHHAEYSKLARQQHEQTIELEAPRGSIFDRYGQRLAMSLPSESVCINPQRVPDFAVGAEILAEILSMDAKELSTRIQQAAADERGFLWIKRRITPEEGQRLRALKFEWIEFRPDKQRFYPNKSLAAHVLGGVDFQGDGNAGIEQSFNEQLKGHAGELRLTSDVQRRGFESKVAVEPQPGSDVHLTIDSRLQFVAEREIEKMVKLHRGKSGTFVAMDPKTGDILALGNYPTYDPNIPPKGGDVTGRENLAVTAPFEPGSVYKTITLSAALETTNLRPESPINCGNGSITLFGRTIHDHGHYWELSMADVLARSSNIGAINIGLRVGAEKLYDYIRRFGFGKRTGLPMPGESPGMVRQLKHWQKTSIGSVAMGHEISVTAIQLAQACSVIANGGFLMKPRLTMDAPASQPVRILKPETAFTMRQMMEGVVLKPYGTGHKYAQLAGYTTAGKTGTAQIYDFRRREYTHLYNASFMGFAPVTNPAIVVVVTINGTEGTAGYGGPTSAPVYREVAATALRLMDVPKDLPEMLAAATSDEAADDNDVAIAGLGSSTPPPLAQSDDAGASDSSAAPAANAADQRTFLAGRTADPNRDLAGPRVPNLLGKTVREIIEQAASGGIQIEFMGSGVARAQIPEPGAILPAGQAIRVQFGR